MAPFRSLRRWIPTPKGITLLIGGVLIGALVMSPVGAHVTGSFNHLWNQHIKPRADARYVNSKPRKQTINLNGFAFSPFDDTGTIVRDDIRGATGVSGTHSLFANVSLPPGATLTRIACQFYDASAGNDLRCLMRYGPRNQGTVSTVGRVDSSGEPGYQLVAETDLNAAKVNNGGTVYWMQVSPIIGSWDGSDTAIKAVIITYRLAATR